MTFPEMLDNAKNGEEFAKVINGLFGLLEKKMDEENEE